MKTALVTGATDGVGRVVATRLAAQGWRVLAHGRNQQRGEQLAREIGATFLKADLSSLSEVRRLAELVKAQTAELQLLINNAGIGSVGDRPGRHESADGHELRFAVNYLAGFQLTHLLLPLLKAGAPARIVNVSSAGQQAIDFDDVMLTRGYSGGRAYCQSKLAQILFTFDLAEELAGTGVTATCLHPATYMDTTMVRRAGVKPWSSVAEGAEAIMNLALSPSLQGRSGLYFNGINQAQPNPQAFDLDARRRLRTLSLELTDLAGQVT